jgi:hypothetical protein
MYHERDNPPGEELKQFALALKYASLLHAEHLIAGKTDQDLVLIEEYDWALRNLGLGHHVDHRNMLMQAQYQKSHAVSISSKLPATKRNQTY